MSTSFRMSASLQCPQFHWLAATTRRSEVSSFHPFLTTEPTPNRHLLNSLFLPVQVLPCQPLLMVLLLLPLPPFLVPPDQEEPKSDDEEYSADGASHEDNKGNTGSET